MYKQFTPCPACGAVGEVGSNCPFCGTTISLKTGIAPSNSRLVPQRNISAQQYAEKLSIFHNVRSSVSPQLMYVNIGDDTGIINLDAEIVYPLQHEYSITIISDSIILLMNKKNENTIFTRSGRKICLGTLLDLATMDRCDGIERTYDGHYYEWKALRCNGEIDPINWKIISRPSLDRTALSMSFSEYKNYEKQKEEALAAERQAKREAERKAKREAEKEAIKQAERSETIKWIVIAIIYLILQELFRRFI